MREHLFGIAVCFAVVLQIGIVAVLYHQFRDWKDRLS